MKLTVPRRVRATVPVGRILATLALTAGLAGSALPAQAAPAEAGTENATGWYLALGDSVGAGYQPGTGDDLEAGTPTACSTRCRVPTPSSGCATCPAPGRT